MAVDPGVSGKRSSPDRLSSVPRQGRQGTGAARIWSGSPGRIQMAKYGRKASTTVASAMRRRKKGTLKSGSGRTVKSRKQAIAIGLSEAREKGAKVPAKRKSTARKATKKR